MLGPALAANRRRQLQLSLKQSLLAKGWRGGVAARTRTPDVVL